MFRILKKKPITRVYHAIPADFGWESRPSTFRPSCYRLVAEVETVDLKMAYSLTNHGEDDWARNRGVKARGNERRSTSVGDILVTPDNRVFRVASFGFIHLFTLE
ncbi:MAG: hypothetical protein KA354_23455 [Phycisphaerae bacterium]|nr:hypothetical protein [Phycisphaerae bacterium]